jgi:hypothetical protein
LLPKSLFLFCYCCQFCSSFPQPEPDLADIEPKPESVKQYQNTL